MGIVVPPVVSTAGLNDSVDVLLEGISRELPDRPRTSSHSDGHSAATYHAEHVVRAPDRAPVGDEPKVVIDRASGKHATRVARYSGPVEEDEREWTETTAIRRQSLSSRVVIALGAGVIVVVAIFVALQRTSNERILFVTGPAPASPATAAPAPNPPSVFAVAPPAAEARLAAPVAAPPAETAAATPSVAAESLPAASAPPAAPAHSVTTSARVNKPKAKAASASKAPSADLGEFKTTF